MQFLLSQDVTEGQGLVEYALIIVLICLAVFGTIIALGGGVFQIYTGITGSLTGAGM